MSGRVANELTDEAYWDEVWSRVRLPRRVEPKDPVHARLARLFRASVPRGGRCLEIGCAASAWLPWFAAELGQEPWGVELSKKGAELTRTNLELQGRRGTVVHGDFLTADLPLGGFRMVFSRGVVEHFKDPSPFFRRSLELLEPGGVKVTLIPNTAGPYGLLQRLLDPAIAAAHEPFTAAQLDAFQLGAGLEPVVPARPFGVFNLGVLRWDTAAAAWPGRLRTLAAYALQTADRLLGWASYPADRLLDGAWSPYFISVYRRPRPR